MQKHIQKYLASLSKAFELEAMQDITILAEALMKAWSENRSIYICGNGGSAGNAIHLANDFIYGAGLKNGGGLRVEALSANAAVITCLANDLSYSDIYSEQIKIKGDPDDILIVLSGSGNSPNVIKAIETANQIGMQTFAILGFTGGRCKDIANYSIHFKVDDMQIAEDLQLIAGHICMQWLNNQDGFKNKLNKDI